MGLQIKKIGWVVSSLTPGQLQYDIFKNSNDYLAKSDDVDISLYWVQDGPRVLQPSFSCMNLLELFSFDGHTICTSLHTLSRAISYPGPNRSKKIYFYDYNLDYTKLPQQMRQWEQLNSMYNHPKVELLARSVEHAEILSSVFGRNNIPVVENCSIDRLKEIIG